MNYSKISLKLEDKISEFSGYVSRKLDKTSRRFLKESIYGIMASQSVMLTEIGRSIKTEVSIKKIEERYCRQLKKEGISEKIHENILKRSASLIKEDSLLILDLGDIEKTYAKRMEYLTTVRDGSEGGKLVKGYWTNQVIAAELNSKEVIPLYSDLYSQQSKDFISENEEIIKAIDKVSSALENKGIWILDRGGDRNKIYSYLLSSKNPWLNKRKQTKQKKFIIRLKGNRNLIHQGTPRNVVELAEGCRCLNRETIIRLKEGKEKIYNISYGYLKVRLPEHQNKQLYLLVVKGFGQKPMMLLTTEVLRRNKKLLQKILYSYIKRWSIEQTIRFIKQNFDLENIRLLKYVRLKNMMALLLAVFYFISVILDGSQKLKIMVGYILQEAKRVFGIPSFHYYAIGDGLSLIFKRSPRNMNTNPAGIGDSFQFTFGFT